MRVAVKRFDPHVDVAPFWATFDVACGPRQTVLDALTFIEEHCDDTIAFRRMCRSGICGTCAGLVNGVSRLFCQTLLSEVDAGHPPPTPADVWIEPLPHFRVLRDLVVDVDPFFDALRAQRTWLVPDEAYDGRIPPARVEPMWHVSGCVLCGICAGLTDDHSSHPAATARVLRLAFDPRDVEGPARLASVDLDACRVVAEPLAEVCPADVDIRPLLRLTRSRVSP
ncbi:MAG: succinate dehydrogenase/fumarate reductase iron-sulfur subunit [Vicinamibacterales bacterium]